MIVSMFGCDSGGELLHVCLSAASSVSLSVVTALVADVAVVARRLRGISRWLLEFRNEHHLPGVLLRQSVQSNVADSYFVTSTVFTRHFSQPALKEVEKASSRL
ncbi:hypothetical protein RND71_013367 [Anisodus tanguticus]|uniref:Uncharacterized protein n=1 Tax=Anisodus tanguticus TaxID=243964 RepID=A0AAE1SGY2_9SOLA|nr:hypothetical protein RND71_013367 [Anisodus tanguticus]